MAFIGKSNGSAMEKVNKTRVHDDVEWTYTVFKDDKLNTILQIDTYGKGSRKMQGRISQSIQMDKESAQYIKSIIESTFLDS